jgi:phosphatidylglycerol:prolipoprotein diacylglycerol transferase
MFPDLIDIGFLHLKTYGACMATGFLLCWTLIERLSGRKDLSNLLIALMVGGVGGSRIAYVIEHWKSEFAANPAAIIRIDQGGLMFYGGFILAFIIFFAWCFLKKERPLALADLLATAVPLGHAFGRIGCFFFGCCYGRDSDAWCAVTFPAGSPSWYEHGRRMVSVLPTQLFEAAALFALFTVLLFVYRARYLRGSAGFGEGFVTGVYLAGYAVIRFGMEFLRGDPRAAVGPFSISQTISLAMAAAGLAFIAAAFSRKSPRL